MALSTYLLDVLAVAVGFAVLSLCAPGVSRAVRLLRSSTLARWINRIRGGLFALLLLTRRGA